MPKAWKFGNNIDTDSLVPGQYLSVLDEKELGKHCLESLSKSFCKNATTGDIVVAGRNFGCGSGRPAPKALKGRGIACVIAASYARIFQRNSINYGFPIIECPEAACDINDQDEIAIDFGNGEIRNITNGKLYKFRQFPEFIRRIIEAGGIVNYTKDEIAKRGLSVAVEEKLRINNGRSGTSMAGSSMSDYDAVSQCLMDGAIDTHVHSNPYAGRGNSSALDIARKAKVAKMKAIVLKCSRFPTGGYAYLISQVVDKLNVFGMTVLNPTIGGLNIAAVEASVILGEGKAGEFTKIISMPTKGVGSFDVTSEKITDICKIIAANNLILATGHLEYAEIVSVVDIAKAQGVSKIIVTHPQQLGCPLSVNQQKELARTGCFMEVCYCQTTKYYRDKYTNHPSCLYTAERLINQIGEVGVERCIFASDFGADPGINPDPTEGLRRFIADMLRYGLTEDDINVMKRNSSGLLGI